MSYLYDLDPVERNRALDDAATHSIDPNALLKPGFFAGSGEGAATGLFSGAIAKPALLLGDAVTPTLMPLADRIDKRFQTHTREWLESEQQKNVDMLKALKERQATYGTAGQVISGVADVAPEATAGFFLGGPAGSAALTGTLQGYADYSMGKAEGLDTGTAAMKGAISGVANAAGVVIPMARVGGSLASNLALGAGVNVGMGMAQRGATGALLESRGYAEQAKQYSWLDKEAIATDAVLGAFFGGLAHFGSPHGAVEPERADAAFVSNERLHTEIDTAPGIPKTPEARDAHVEAQLKATEQMLRGEPVDVADIAHRVDAIEQPRQVELFRDQAEVLHDELPKSVMEPEALPREVVPIKPEGLEQFPANGGVIFEMPLTKEGERVGHLAGSETDRAVTITDAQLAQEHRGQGQSSAAYRSLADYALAQGKELHSDNSVSPDAARVYDAMEKRGYKVEKNPGAAMEQGAWRTQDKSPVYRVTGKEDIRAGFGKEEGPVPKVHDGTPESMAKAGDVRPVENDMTRQVLESAPDLKIVNDNGELVSAKELLSSVDREIETAQREGALHEVAVACFLRG